MAVGVGQQAVRVAWGRPPRGGGRVASRVEGGEAAADGVVEGLDAAGQAGQPRRSLHPHGQHTCWCAGSWSTAHRANYPGKNVKHNLT